MDRGVSPAQVRPVHDVVVHERERVQQLERGTGVDDDRVVVRAARAHVRPVTEGRPQPLAARPHELAQRDERFREVGVDGPPPHDLVVDQRRDARFDAAPDLRQARRDQADAVGQPPCLGPRCHREIVRCRPVVRIICSRSP